MQHAALIGRRAVFRTELAFRGKKVMELAETQPILAAS
jgi:hypothetical protein